MEITGSDNSDKDKRMMNSFEKEDDADKKKDPKKSDKKPSIFESAKEDKKPEKDKSLFDIFKADEKTEKDTEPGDIEKLDDAETVEVTEQYVEARTEEVKQELEGVEPDSEAEAAAIANALLLENIKEKLDAEEPVTDELLDEVMAETIDDLDLESESELEDDEPTPTTPLVPPVRPVTPTPVVPPPPVATPSPAVFPAPFAPVGANPTPHTPNVAPSPVVHEVERSRGPDILLGGVIGYLIGKRRGRIKTEKRLLPVQEKLEKEVKELHSKVAEREEKIRQLAIEKVQRDPETSGVVIKRLEAKREAKHETLEETPEEKPENLITTRAERLGRMIVPSMERTPDMPQAPEAKQAEVMTLPQLLETARRIEVDGVSVKQIYENGRLDSIGLRRVVDRFLKGENFQATLAENMKHHESPEYLKHQAVAQAGGGINGTGGAAFNPVNSSSPQPSDQSVSSRADSRNNLMAPRSVEQQKTTVAIISAVILGLFIAIAFLI